MHTIIKFLAISLLFLLPSSCMQHNGNIGDFFGTWKLTSYQIDGAEVESYEGNSFFQFQSAVVRVVTVYPHQLYRNTFGQWSQEGETLCLDFSFTANAPGEYDAPADLGFQNAKNLLHIVSLTSRNMHLTMQLPDGSTATYLLSKQ